LWEIFWKTGQGWEDNIVVEKGKVKLSLCLAKHHPMKTYWRCGDTDPRIL